MQARGCTNYMFHFPFSYSVALIYASQMAREFITTRFQQALSPQSEEQFLIGRITTLGQREKYLVSMGVILLFTNVQMLENAVYF